MDGERVETTQGRPSDVYYFTPEGTKLVSFNYRGNPDTGKIINHEMQVWILYDTYIR